MSPSQFSALLRRSKFASYDPAIAQVYTSHGGYSYRGDFGLKRPLPKLARKRLPNVMISRIDTPEYQTEWKDAEEKQKWIRRWDEMSVPVEAPVNGMWHEQSRLAQDVWVEDSDFDRSEKPLASQFLRVVRPPIILSQRQFDRELKNAREARPQFREYIGQFVARAEANAAANKAAIDARTKKFDPSYRVDPAINSASSSREPVNLYKLAQTPLSEKEIEDKRTNTQTIHREFLSKRAEERFRSHGASTFIAPLPHRFAGLNYHHPSLLQSVLTTPPIPGHVIPSPDARSDLLQENNRPGSPTPYYAIVAGQVATLPPGEVSTERTGSVTEDARFSPFQFFPNPHLGSELRQRIRKSGRGSFRFKKVILKASPSAIVSKSISPRKVEMSFEATSWASSRTKRPLPYIPGTPKYVASEEKKIDSNVNKGSYKLISEWTTKEYVPYGRRTVADDGVLKSTLSNLLSRDTRRPRD